MHTSLEQQLDKLILATMNYRVPDRLEDSNQDGLTLESVLAETPVVPPKAAVNGGDGFTDLLQAGPHEVYLETRTGVLRGGISVYPAAHPERSRRATAPLLLYHHGFSEFPYDRSCRRIFQPIDQFGAHIVCIQAPYHFNWYDPLRKGFASLRNIYQMLAGSLRLMATMQKLFQAEGAPYTVVAGLSWGGMTGLLYQSLFGRAQAVVPLLSSPDLAQVLLDTATMFRRPLPVAPEILKEALDFTPYYQRCDQDCIYPMLAENDLFFRIEHHAAVFNGRPLVTIPQAHITGFWNIASLRQHIMSVLLQVEREFE